MIQNLEQHYKVLGLKPGASLEEVNQAYKDLVFIWHPDRVPQDNERLVQKSVEKLQQINEARDSLRSYHRKYPQQAAKAKHNQPKSPSYSRNPYYSDRPKSTYSNSDQNYRQSYSANSSYQQTRPGDQANAQSRQRQQTYTSPDYQQPRSPQPGRPWDYRAYYTSGNASTSQSTGRDGYQDFRQPEKQTGHPRPPASNYSRPYGKSLRGADLSKSNFKERDFAGRDLSEADLSYSDLSDTFLHKIILENANLQGANLKGANLLQANLRGANLQEANLIGADLSGSDLSGANLNGAKVGFSNKIMVKITAVKLTGATLPDGSIHP